MAVTIGDAILYITGNSDRLNNSLAQTEGRVRSWGGQVGGFLQNTLSFAFANVITSGLNQVTDALEGLVEGMVGGNAEFEDFDARFTTLLGNAQLAEQRLGDLAQFGATTPFELPGVVQADIILQAFGFHAADAAARFGKSGEEVRRIAGDVASGVGVAFDEIAQLLGRFSSGDTADVIRRMSELGITTREELKALGLEFSNSGQLLTDTVTATGVILELMQEKYGGLMDLQSSTLNGMLSNLSDWVGMTKRILGEPIFERFREQVGNLVDFLSTDTVSAGIQQLADTTDAALDVLETFFSFFIGGGLFEQAEGVVQNFTDRLRGAQEFLVQLNDELRGMTAGDIMAELAPGLADLQAQMTESLADLEERHERTVTNITGQLENAGIQFEETMAGIAEKFEPKMTETAGRFERTIGDMETRLSRLLSDSQEDSVAKTAEHQVKLQEMERAHNKKKAELSAQIIDQEAKLEEKLTELKTEHNRKRRQLTLNLLLAESEEEFLRIQDQLKQEDDKFNEQEQKAKDSNKVQTEDLKARLREEEDEYNRQVDKVNDAFDKMEAKSAKMLDRQESDLRESIARQESDRDKALAKILADRQKEEDAAQELYDNTVSKAETALDEEARLYKTQQEEIRLAFQQQMAEFEAEIARRAAAIGTGPAAEAGQFLLDLVDKVKALNTAVGEFLTQYADPLIGILIGIGTVLIGGGVIAAISALVAAISGIGLPIIAIVGAIALLYTAWQQNWFGIREIVQGAIDFIGPYIEQGVDKAFTFVNQILEMGRAWWDEHGEAVMTIVNRLWQLVTQAFNVAVETIRLSIEGLLLILNFLWSQHGDWFSGFFTLLWENIKLILSGALDIITFIIEAWAALIEGDYQRFGAAIQGIWQTIWDTLRGVLSNTLGMMSLTVGEFIETVLGMFVPEKWIEAGSNMLKGLGQGAKDGIEGVKDLLKGGASGLLNSLKGALDIRSPSGLFAREVGQPIGEGVGVGAMSGLDQAKEQLSLAVKNLAGNLQPALGGAGGGPQTVAFSQTNNIPAPPAGFDIEGLMAQIREMVIRLLAEYYEKATP